ncbi:hypothetical protein QTP70_026490 [Hemibagrus guttatus]|uniref:Uncharacterized protein n=1 Tax=Hemibagrus guttatus TaxID=175788 RepID=A0AAE0QF83_9TELE|nr:hypothetical protein QTP70_026490 [Hemibagrus guttatus]
MDGFLIRMQADDHNKSSRSRAAVVLLTYTCRKMDKCKDLSEFDKGRIVMARPLDQSISKTAALVGCSQSVVPQTSQGAHADPMHRQQWGFEHQNWTTEQWKKVAWSDESRFLHVDGRVCASLTWGTHGTRMHYGKKVSQRRQCHALGNVLLGNLGSCHPCGCYFDTYHLPKHCCSPCTPFHGNGIIHNAPCHKAKMMQEWFDDHNNEFEVMTWTPNSPDLSPIQHLWDVLDKQF